MKDFALKICSIKENTLTLQTKTREFLISERDAKKFFRFAPSFRLKGLDVITNRKRKDILRHKGKLFVWYEGNK
jgi:hypothetical protein